MRKTYSIYRIWNTVTGKSYIGYTSQPVSYRWSAHKSRAFQSKDHANLKLYRSIRKHGVDAFQYETLYQSSDYEHTLKWAEPFFIAKFDSFIRGYNCTTGGEGTIGYKFDPDVVKDIHEKRRRTFKERGYTFRNRRHTEESKRKMSETRKGRIFCKVKVTSDILCHSASELNRRLALGDFQPYVAQNGKVAPSLRQFCNEYGPKCGVTSNGLYRALSSYVCCI